MSSVFFVLVIDRCAIDVKGCLEISYRDEKIHASMANNGAQALEAVQDVHYDLILLAGQFAYGETGVDVLNLLRGKDNIPPVLSISGDSDLQRSVLDAGADGVCDKEYIMRASTRRLLYFQQCIDIDEVAA